MKIFCKDIQEFQWEASSDFILNKSIHLWLTDVQTDAEIISELKKFLSTDELKRSDRFAFEKDRNQFITAHGTLRNILAKYIDTVPSQIQLKKTTERKPFVSHPSTLIKFNISHSENKILIAIAENEIGVDIELIKKSFETSQIIKSYFSENEQKAISVSKDQQAIFYKFWTRKEAILKASGIGITDHLKDIGICESENTSNNFKQDYFIASFKIEEFFWGSIASSFDSPLKFLKA